MEAQALPSVACLGQSLSAGIWFRDSGIQLDNGGVSRYYRGDTQTHLPVSTEITGYAAHGLLGIDPDAALRAGEFLVNYAWDEDQQTFPFETDGTQSAYFFDLGIIARGLLALWRYTGSSLWLEMAAAAGDAMLRDFEAHHGYHVIVDLPGKRPRDHSTWWSQRSGCFQLKAALAWRELADATGNHLYWRHFQRQLDFAVETAPEFFALWRDDLRVMDLLHAYCYYLEGLLADWSKHAGLIRDGIQTVQRYRRTLQDQFLRSDVCAQLLRVRLLAHHLDVVRLDAAAAEEEVSALRVFQMDSEDPRLNGAFAFGIRQNNMLPHANPVSTIFALQALQWWSDYEAGTFNAVPVDII